jgi:hypothetical protein
MGTDVGGRNPEYITTEGFAIKSSRPAAQQIYNGTLPVWLALDSSSVHRMGSIKGYAEGLSIYLMLISRDAPMSCNHLIALFLAS